MKVRCPRVLPLVLPLALALLAAAPALAQSGAACMTGDDCASGEVCAHRTGHCTDVGVCTLEMGMCADLYDPVCGCDGRTYTNDCFAMIAGVSVAARGTCEKQVCRHSRQCADGFYCAKEMGSCKEQGMCTLMPTTCMMFMLHDPVCGCDGKTYGNDCLAAMAGVSVAVHAPCPNDVCAGNGDCAAGDFCLKPAGACGAMGLCQARPQVCLMIYDPVCGCDGQIYGNSCLAAEAGVSVQNPGEVCAF